MNLPRLSLFVVLAVILGISTAGCMDRETVLSGDDATEVLAYAEPIVDNLMQGFNEGNYAKYSRDFGPEMKQALDEAAFAENHEFVTSRIGLYESRGDPVVTKTGEYVAVTYRAKFEREDGVALQFVFEKDDPSHRLQGLWFDSPMLRS